MYETITVDGKPFDVILGPKHKLVLREMAAWGRPARAGRQGAARTERRSTDPRRLVKLLDADKPGSASQG